MSSEDTLKKDPAVIAKLLGWEHFRAWWGRPRWVGAQGNFKAWVDDWNPYTSDADAMMALLEWQKLDPDSSWNLSGGTDYRGCCLRGWTDPADGPMKAWDLYKGGTTPAEAITTALERWGDA